VKTQIQFQTPKPIRIPSFKGYVAYDYYDAGSDMDRIDIWRVEITPERVSFEQVTEVPDKWEAFGNWHKIHKVFDVIDKEIIDKIRNKRCPFCNRRMKVVRKSFRKRFSETGYYLRYKYPDLKPYDTKESFFFTCFKCRVKCSKEYETQDGGAVLDWRFTVERNGKEAVYSKYGFYNDRKHFLMYMRFIKALHEMGLIKVEG